MEGSPDKHAEEESLVTVKTRALPKGPHYVYVLRGKKKTSTVLHYIGYTNDIKNRLKEHNGILKGGARSTKGGNWKVLCSLTGFKSYGEALAAEWRFKHPSGRRGRSKFSGEGLNIVLSGCRWSKKHAGLEEASGDGRIYTLSIDKGFLKDIDTARLHKSIVVEEF
jgi:predicted GIY-YIG superfamily endonuclease